MDKCREAFEKTPDIAKRISNGVYFNENLKIYREIKGSCRGATFVNGAWCVWQSRQSEFDAITEAILNQTQLLAKKQAEVDQLKEAIERQGKLAIQAMNEAHKGSRLELSIAKDIQASLKPELIESERQMNAELTDENMRLEARIEAALKHANLNFWNAVTVGLMVKALRGEHEA